MYTCKKCGVTKSNEEYYKAHNKRGLTTTCKDCIKIRVKEHREENMIVTDLIIRRGVKITTIAFRK